MTEMQQADIEVEVIDPEADREKMEQYLTSLT